jgi:hypothetical protein
MTDQIEPQEVQQQPVEAQEPAGPVAEDALGVAVEPEEARSNEDDVLMQIDSHEEEVGVAADTEPAVDLPDELKEEQTEQPSADAVSAREVLKRDGWDESDLAGMDEAVLIKMAAHRRKVQQDVDRKLRERGASDSDDRDEETQSDPEPQPAEPTGQPETADLLTAIQPIAEHLGLDDEGAKLLASAHEAAVQPLQSVLQQQNQVIEQLHAQVLRMDIERARQGLSEQFPQLANTAGEDFQRVIKRMDELSDSGSYETIDGLMRAAVGMEFGNELADAAEAAQAQIRRQRTNGQMANVSTQPDKVARKLSAEELEDQVLAILESDDPNRVEKARALSGR